MSISEHQNPASSVAPDFQASVTRPRKDSKRGESSPFSLRLSTIERAELERLAAGMPLGAFIREKSFDGTLRPRKTRGQAPVKDHAALAQVLGALGTSRLSSPRASISLLTRAA